MISFTLWTWINPKGFYGIDSKKEEPSRSILLYPGKLGKELCHVVSTEMYRFTPIIIFRVVSKRWHSTH